MYSQAQNHSNIHHLPCSTAITAIKRQTERAGLFSVRTSAASIALSQRFSSESMVSCGFAIAPKTAPKPGLLSLTT
jgi:hypothetical protein